MTLQLALGLTADRRVLVGIQFEDTWLAAQRRPPLTLGLVGSPLATTMPQGLRDGLANLDTSHPSEKASVSHPLKYS